MQGSFSIFEWLWGRLGVEKTVWKMGRLGNGSEQGTRAFKGAGKLA
jgi:hypothetical protein